MGVRVVERTLPATNFVLISYQNENHYIRNAAGCLPPIVTRRHVFSEFRANARVQTLRVASWPS
jgi:hypothetical protein